ncbi:MAG: hypothetical protein WBI77_00260, partial [Tepidanaerobacteraceae bacterium]
MQDPKINGHEMSLSWKNSKTHRFIIQPNKKPHTKPKMQSWNLDFNKRASLSKAAVKPIIPQPSIC